MLLIMQHQRKIHIIIQVSLEDLSLFFLSLYKYIIELITLLWLIAVYGGILSYLIYQFIFSCAILLSILFLICDIL